LEEGHSKIYGTFPCHVLLHVIFTFQKNSKNFIHVTSGMFFVGQFLMLPYLDNEQKSLDLNSSRLQIPIVWRGFSICKYSHRNWETYRALRGSIFIANIRRRLPMKLRRKSYWHY